MSKSFKKDRDFYDEVDEKQKKKIDRFIRQVKKHRREVDMKQDSDTRPKK